MSIRTKLILALLVFAAVPMVTMGAPGFFNARNSLKETRIAGLESTADLKAERIEEFFWERRGDIDLARGRATVKRNLPILAGLAGDTSSLAYREAKQELDLFLVEVQQTYRYLDTFLANTEGTVVYESSDDPVHPCVGGHLPDSENRAFVEGQKRIYFGDVFASESFPGHLAMLVSAPVEDEQGKLIGVMVFEIDMGLLYEVVQETTGLGETGETLIAAKTEAGALFLNPLRHDPGAAFSRIAVFGEREAVPIQEALLGRSGSGESIDYRGEEVVAAWRPIPYVNWGMVAKIDSSEAFRSVTNLRDLGLALGGAVLLLSVLVAAIISRAMVRPIRSLEEGAGIIGGGDLSYRVGTQAKDEIGRLSRAFDQMTSDLQRITASRDDLDREVRSRKRAEEEREVLITELEVKNAELEQFTYTVSHDLKSPLITIKGFLGLLGQDTTAGDPERIQADMARISSAAEHMGRLLDDLLELSRIGRAVGPTEEILLGELADEAVALVAGQVAERKAQVTVAANLPIVFGDRLRIRALLQNLLDNAIKFMGEEPDPLVEIGVRQGGGEPVYYVRDNGIGIDPRYNQRVFGLFDQLDQKADGTGVGLALVKRIVEGHGGRIWVESGGLGHGATFCFTLQSKGETVRNERS